ncbi:MAG: cache domain-containing protein [Nanoarchaeota archaeon]|nr:cache domain-containing protein [Nanoarchaeota archaeon]
MKPGKIFFVLSVALVLTVWGGLLYDSIYIESQAFKEQVKNGLVSVSELREERIGDWILEQENDIQILADSNSIKELLTQNTSSSELAIKLNIDNHANIISSNIENYIRSNPGMTLKALQYNAEFNSIIIQPIGKEGYTSLIVKQRPAMIINQSNNFTKFIYNLSDKDKRSEEILAKAISLDEDSSGFYNWINPDGKVVKKYVYFSVIQAKTLDGYEFILMTTGYVDNYQTIKNVPKDIDNYLSKFRINNDYHNLILISTDGNIIYMNHEMENFGGNLKWKENINTGIAKNYQNAKITNNISFFGPFVMHYGEIFMKMSIISPVYSEEKLLGFVGLIKGMDDVIEISTEVTGLLNTGDIYIVNEESLLVSPLRFRHLDLLTQSIKTENVEKCMQEIAKNKKGNIAALQPQKERGFDEFLNYRGDLTLGIYKTIPMTNWCLLAEVNKEEILQVPIRSQVSGSSTILFITMLFALIFLFYVKTFLDKNYKLRKRGP